jgi:hypothetical protein
MRCRAVLLATVGIGAAVVLAPSATAAPECIRTTTTTTQCQTPGHTQIVTSPPAMNNDPWWPYGGFAIAVPR